MMKVQLFAPGRDVEGETGGTGASFLSTGPAVILQVEQGSEADLAGLKIGDHIISINGQVVSHVTNNQVCEILV